MRDSDTKNRSRDVLANFLVENKFEDIDGILQKFDVYFDLLIFYNSQFNITSITTPEDVYLKHFIDCALGHKYVFGSVIDVGTGGGFPGLVLKILKPSHPFLLVDSLNKRINFLNEVISKLALPFVQTKHSRAEDLKKDVLFDTAVCRAVAPLNVLAEYCLPFVKLGGSLVAYKSDNIEDEISAAKPAIKILGGKISAVDKQVLPSTDIIRSFVIITKVAPTPSIYPRGGNKCKLCPL